MEVCMSNNLTVAEGHEINGLGERLRRYHRIIFKMDIYICCSIYNWVEVTNF